MPRILAACLVVAFLTGCATASPILVPSTTAAFTKSGSSSSGLITWNGQRVLVLSPRVIYRDVATEREISGPNVNHPWGSNILKSSSTPSLYPPAVTNSLVSFANQSLAKRGYQTVESGYPAIQNQPVLQEILGRWAEEPRELLRPWSKNRDQILRELRMMKESLGVDAVLVQLMDVKVGSPGTWDAMASGRITSETSTSDLKTGLVESGSGRVVWKREVFFRDVPNAKLLDDSLRILYGDFPARENKTLSGGAGKP